ncbi:tyrosine-protein phosphatase [Gordonia sp. DT30]|uniref:tyrosine-protein phosphatase n=1 Tax=unclassified Gordonia (in: high G+C Gram-positive bacteria) TaxID=2657482 RepID=UPI003CECD008
MRSLRSADRRSFPFRTSVAAVLACATIAVPVTATTMGEGLAHAAPASVTGGQVVVPVPAAISIPDVENVRTFANYRTVDGHAITDRVIRSANLSTLTPVGVANLQKRHLASIIDLRTTIEDQLQADKPVPGATVHHFDVFRASPPADLINLTEGYRQFVSNPVARQAFGDSLRNISQTVADGGAVLFHCSAGKDRTGWLAVTLLTVLGVRHDVVVDDYLASNTFRHASPNDPIDGVNIGYLNSAFDQVHKDYGTFDSYVHKGLGLTDADVAGLKHALLLPAN